MSDKAESTLTDVNDADGGGGVCPVAHNLHPTEGSMNQVWWPNRLNLSILRKRSPASNPMGGDFDYAAEFNSLDFPALKRDIAKLMTDSQDWWPADFGNYGPLMTRMAWHAAGTYRIADGHGGAGAAMQRFAPLNSWPDNVLLDRARRLLWPVKKQYGRKISWADLMVLAGNVAMESMGFTTFGYGGGRVDAWEAEDDVYWGSESTWLGDERHGADGKLDSPLAAVQMGLIYVNPEGPGGIPDPLTAARATRESFRNMAMDDEETLALIAGGHTFGKTHGAADPSRYVGPSPEAAPMEEMGLGWKNSYGSGKGRDAIGSGLEVTWTNTPTTWDNRFFEILFGYEWELVKSPAGAWQYQARDEAGANTFPDPEDGTLNRPPTMLVTDVSFRVDPIYEPIARRFLEHPDEFANAYARAWFKLTHRDMGPISRYLGPEVPAEELIWQDPVPAVDHELVDASDIAALKEQVLSSELSLSQLVSTAWASASTFRDSDKRGGANGARIRLLPQVGWEANQPAELAHVLQALEEIRESFNNDRIGGKQISLADLIVLAGCAGVEQAARNAGHAVVVPFSPGRTDASQEQTNIESFALLEPAADGFRNYLGTGNHRLPAEHLLLERANQLTLSVPEMTVLIGGLRSLGTNFQGSSLGVFTSDTQSLTNDFFVSVLDMGTEWSPTSESAQTFQGRDRATNEAKWTASRVDLVFGANSELRAISEVYASNDAKEKFVRDFVATWDKVMNLDRFDLA